MDTFGLQASNPLLQQSRACLKNYPTIFRVKLNLRDAAERNHQARCPPSLNFRRINSEMCPYNEPSGSSVTLARRTTIDAFTPNDEENRYSLTSGDCSIERSDGTCESQLSLTSDTVSELDDSLVNAPSQIDVTEDKNGSTAFTTMYNWGCGSFGSLWHHKSEPVEILRPECSLVSYKNPKCLTCVSINENHSAAVTCTGCVIIVIKFIVAIASCFADPLTIFLHNPLKGDAGCRHE